MAQHCHMCTCCCGTRAQKDRQQPALKDRTGAPFGLCFARSCVPTTAVLSRSQGGAFDYGSITLGLGSWAVAAESTKQCGSASAPRPYLQQMTRAYRGHHDVQPITSTGDVAGYLAKLGAYVTKSVEALRAGSFEHGHVAMHAVRFLLREHSPERRRWPKAWILVGSCCTVAPQRGSTSHGRMNWTATQCLRPIASGVPRRMPCLFWSGRAYDTNVMPPRRYRRRKLGLTAAAVVFAARTRDDYFGQWLVANVPCPSARELWHPHAAHCPPQHKWFVVSWRLRPQVWDAPADIRRQLATESAHRPQYVEHVVRIYRSWQQLVSFWLVAPPLWRRAQRQ